MRSSQGPRRPHSRLAVPGAWLDVSAPAHRDERLRSVRGATRPRPKFPEMESTARWQGECDGGGSKRTEVH